MKFTKKTTTKKPMRRRVYRRRANYRKGPGKIAKGLSQSIIPFKRTVSQMIDTNQISNLPANWAMSSSGVTGYHALLATQVFQLSQLPEYQNIQSLYKWYKINCVVVKLYPCYAVSQQTGNTIQTNGTYYGQNVMCTYTKNLSGIGLSSTIDQNYWLTQQARKERIITGTRPHIFKVYPKLQNEVYQSLSNTDYTVMKPKFISTTEPSTPHFGLDMAFTFVDYNAQIQVDNAPNYYTPIKFRMEMTYYIQLKGTH